MIDMYDFPLRPMKSYTYLNELTDLFITYYWQKNWKEPQEVLQP